MAFGGGQKVDELAEHMRADRLALVSAGLHGIVGVDAEMVRPEPYQSLGKAEFGAYGAVVVRLGLAEEILPHRSFRLRLGCRLCLRRFCFGTPCGCFGVCGLFHPGGFASRAQHHRIIGGELRSFLLCGFLCRLLCCLLALVLQLLLCRSFGNEVRRHAARRSAAHQPGSGNLAGVRLVELGEKRASRVRCDRRDGTGARSEAEPVECESRFPEVEGHEVVPPVDVPPDVAETSVLPCWRRLTRRGPNRGLIGSAGKRTAERGIPAPPLDIARQSLAAARRDLCRRSFSAARIKL